MNENDNKLRNDIEKSIRDKEYLNAIDLLNRYISENHDDPYGYIRKTVVLRFLKRYDEADSLLDCCLNIFTPNFLLLLVHLDTAVDRRNIDDASQRLEALRYLFPQQPKVCLRGISISIINNEISKALDLSNEYVDIRKNINYYDDKGDIKIFLNLLEICIRKNLHNEALRLSKKLCQVFTKDIDIYLKIFQIYKKISDFNKCESLAECLLNNFNPNFSILKNFSNILIYNKKLKDAIDVLSLMTKLFPFKNEGYEINDTINVCRQKFDYKRKLKVGFVLNSSSQYEHLFPVFDEMLNDIRFSPFFLCYTLHKQSISTIDFLHSKYKEENIIYGSSTLKGIPVIYDFKPDVVFLQRPYIRDYPYEMSPEILSAYSRIAYIPYGTSLHVAGKHGTYKRTKLLESLWVFFAETEYHIKLYKQMFNCKNFVASGHPKLETINNYINTCNTNNNSKKLIFWNVHLGSTSFKKYINIIYKILEDDDFIFIIRPHPFARRYCEINKIMSVNEYDNIFNSIIKKGGIFQDANSGDQYLETLAKTDIFISDFSSLILEFSLTKRPCIYLSNEKQDDEWLCDFSRNFIDKYAYISKKLEDLDKYVFMLKNPNNDFMSINRAKFIDSLALVPNHNVSKFICNYIYDKILSENM